MMRFIELIILTGESIGKVIPVRLNGVTACAVDGTNRVFTAHVAPGSPITEFSPTFDLLSVVTPASLVMPVILKYLLMEIRFIGLDIPIIVSLFFQS